MAFVSPAGAKDSGLCDSALSIETNFVLRGSAQLSTENECFTAEVLSAGTWMLDLDVLRDSAAAPRIELHGRRCDSSGSGQSFQYREKLANSLLVDIYEPGHYTFCVAAQDPLQPLGDYRLTGGFAATNLRKNDPDEDQPEPDPFAGCQQSASFVFKDDPDEDQPEPDPFASPGTTCRELYGLCQLSLTDDHGDTLRCATPVLTGQVVTAEIRNQWGDDDDYFTFTLKDLASVRIATNNASDSIGSLYDRHGYLLSSGGSEYRQGFRIVRTLSPGRYYVRVAGRDGTEGPYELELEILDRDE